MAGSLQVALEAAEATLAVCNSKVGKADVLDGAGKPREQARKDEIKVYWDVILHIPREQAKKDEIKVWGLWLIPLLPIYN
jgi:hypothetical protein